MGRWLPPPPAERAPCLERQTILTISAPRQWLNFLFLLFKRYVVFCSVRSVIRCLFLGCQVLQTKRSSRRQSLELQKCEEILHKIVKYRFSWPFRCAGCARARGAGPALGALHACRQAAAGGLPSRGPRDGPDPSFRLCLSVGGVPPQTGGGRTSSGVSTPSPRRLARPQPGGRCGSGGPRTGFGLSWRLRSDLRSLLLHREPVTRDEAEDYYDVVTHPMDFQTMQNKCSCGSYRSVQEFLADMKQVFANAELYNCRGSHVLTCMVKTEQCLVALLHKHLPGHPYVRRKRKKFPDRLAEDEGDSESEPIGQSRGRRQKK